MRILLAVFLIFMVIFFVIRLADGNNDPSPQETGQSETVEPVVLGEHNNSLSTVEFTVVGKTTAPETHREIRFTITQDRRTVQIISGYDGKVIDTMTLGNTSNSYQQLLYAIEEEGYSKAKKEPRTIDRNGVCSGGKQYLYMVKVNGQTRNDLWSTSCSIKQGTFAGDRSDIVKLFEKQFPEYKDFVRGVKL